jgi:uncharacterized protein YfaS (alpha-2-macroglobulin family)
MLQGLRSRQQADGGFVLWPGQRASDPELSLYVAHFLLAARQQGHTVPSDMLNPLLGQLRRLAQQPQQDLEQARQRATAIYLLIRNGEVMSNQLVHLHEGLQREHADRWQSTLVASYLAASYQLLRKQREAEALIEAYRPQGDAEQRHIFQDRLSQDAQHLYLLAQHFPQRLQGLPAQRLDALLEPIMAGEVNTHSAAWSILSLGAWGKAALGSAGVETILMEQRLAEGWQRLDTLPQPFVHGSPAFDAQGLRLQGQGPLFYQLAQAGFDRQLPTRAIRQGLEIQREFVDGEGNLIDITQGRGEKSLRDGAIQVGQELTVRLRLRSTDQRHHQQVAVIDLLPGGFVVERDSLPREPQFGILPMPRPAPEANIYPPPGGWQPDYVDIREDRVLLYGSFGPELSTIEYRVRATAAGQFSVPPAYAEAMYDRRVRAAGLPGSLVVSGDAE